MPIIRIQKPAEQRHRLIVEALRSKGYTVSAAPVNGVNAPRVIRR